MKLCICKIALSCILRFVKRRHISRGGHKKDTAQRKRKHCDNCFLSVFREVHQAQAQRGQLAAEFFICSLFHTVLRYIAQRFHWRNSRRKSCRLMYRNHCNDINNRKYKNNDPKGVPDVKSVWDNEISSHTADQNTNRYRAKIQHPALTGHKLFHLFLCHTDGTELSKLMDFSNDRQVKYPVNHKDTGKQNNRPDYAVKHHKLHIHRQ